MIFFGTKGKILSGKVVEDIQCPSCENHQFNFLPPLYT